MNKHTPGDWQHIDCTNKNINISATRDNGTFARIGEVFSPRAYMPSARHLFGTEEQATANARLIAAAPDLLAVIMRCREYVERAASRWEDDAAASLDFMDAAIDKATGGV